MRCRRTACCTAARFDLSLASSRMRTGGSAADPLLFIGLGLVGWLLPTLGTNCGRAGTSTSAWTRRCCRSASCRCCRSSQANFMKPAANMQPTLLQPVAPLQQCRLQRCGGLSSQRRVVRGPHARDLCGRLCGAVGSPLVTTSAPGLGCRSAAAGGRHGAVRPSAAEAPDRHAHRRAARVDDAAAAPARQRQVDQPKARQKARPGPAHLSSTVPGTGPAGLR